jgi:hypothetical protein
MQRFLLFGGDQYYPLGGWQDYKGDFDTKEQALKEAANWSWDWYQIVDSKKGEIVEEHSKR